MMGGGETPHFRYDDDPYINWLLVNSEIDVNAPNPFAEWERVQQVFSSYTKTEWELITRQQRAFDLGEDHGKRGMVLDNWAQVDIRQNETQAYNEGYRYGQSLGY